MGQILYGMLTWFSARKEPLPLSTTEEEETSPNLLSNNCSPPIIDGLDKLSQNLKDMLITGRNSDVTLVVKGKGKDAKSVRREFKVHKNILVCRSPVFEKMFEHEMVEQSSGSVEIIDFEPDVFHTFLIYLYAGKVETLNVNSAIELYRIADRYGIEGLTADCIKFLLNNLSEESFCGIVELALVHTEPELLEHANVFFANNMKRIIVNDNWKTFITENPAEANELLMKALSGVEMTPK